MITIDKLHKHFDYIIKNSKELDSDVVVRYIDELSEKIHIPFEDIIEDFVTYWRKVIKGS